MDIGIDFDNTIAWYDDSFREVALAEEIIERNWEGDGKKELRNHLRRRSGGEKMWMRLQGLVYGKFMHRALLMPGVANFLLSCKGRKHRVFIVSHKTVYGHFDPEKIPLRQEALKWMVEKRFFDPGYFGMEKENVFFANTREEKAEKIARLNCDYFIDDLPEVFAEDKFPTRTQGILLGKFDTTKISSSIKSMRNWEDIFAHVLGSTTDGDVGLWAGLMTRRPIERIDRVSGRGNSRLYKAMTANGKRFALKHYPDRFTDARPRLKTEFNALWLLHQHNITNVPKAIEKDQDLNLGLFEWIEGECVTSPSAGDFKQAVDFIERLHFLSRKIDGNGIELASEACLSAAELIGQIERRFKRLAALRGSQPELASFLEHTFEPLLEEVKDKSWNLWPNSSRDKSLPREKQTMSPSDFGFHNALKDGGKITFIDFEYFGWDDPVKIMADFVWHPAMELDSSQRTRWLEGMFGIFRREKDLRSRYRAAWPLYGLRWAMILLNEFHRDMWRRRVRANQGLEQGREQKLKQQLRKAADICLQIRDQDMECPYA